ncbi:MAG: hypothetical protein HYS61_04970 [Acidobacteria bacterium]|nr:hypothetical protein [Acidobacteriota bacterium]
MKKTIWGLLLLVPGLAAAQSSQESWENLKQLAPGEDVRIVLNDAKSYGAKFESVNDEAITVRLVTGEQTFSRENVLRVSTKGRSRRLRNALIGAGVGVGLGFVGAAAGNRNDPEARAIAYVLAPPVFGGIGAAVGAVMPTGGWHDVYRAK